VNLNSVGIRMQVCNLWLIALSHNCCHSHIFCEVSSVVKPSALQDFTLHGSNVRTSTFLPGSGGGQLPNKLRPFWSKNNNFVVKHMHILIQRKNSDNRKIDITLVQYWAIIFVVEFFCRQWGVWTPKTPCIQCTCVWNSDRSLAVIIISFCVCM